MNRTISKYLTVISLSLISVSTLMAQSYERMWTEVKTAVQKDHPQTALDAVNHIYRKAQTENNDGQLMRAMLTARLLHAEVSPGSGKVATNSYQRCRHRQCIPRQDITAGLGSRHHDARQSLSQRLSPGANQR